MHVRHLARLGTADVIRHTAVKTQAVAIRLQLESRQRNKHGSSGAINPTQGVQPSSHQRFIRADLAANN
jgi:hypothetical protein